jgi:hypothetical protein
MTDHREQAIRDVAAAFMLSTSYINDCLVKPYTCDDERIAYAVAQRESVLGLEQVCGETYQLLGAVLCDHPNLIPKAAKWLDNLSNGRVIHADLLPVSPDDITFGERRDCRCGTNECCPKCSPPVEAQLQQKEGERG